MEEWDDLYMFQCDSDGWEDVTVDLSDYSGEVYLGFYAYSDVSINRPGWYIDDVQLTDESENGSAVSLGLETDSGDSLRSEERRVGKRGRAGRARNGQKRRNRVA